MLSLPLRPATSASWPSMIWAGITYFTVNEQAFLPGWAGTLKQNDFFSVIKYCSHSDRNQRADKLMTSQNHGRPGGKFVTEVKVFVACREDPLPFHSFSLSGQSSFLLSLVCPLKQGLVATQLPPCPFPAASLLRELGHNPQISVTCSDALRQLHFSSAGVPFSLHGIA